MPFVPVATSVHQSVGYGVRALGRIAVRSAPCASVVRTPAAGEGDNTLRIGSNSLVGAPGRKASILTEQARASRDHAPRFLGSGNTGKARQHSQYPAPEDPWQGFRGGAAHIDCKRTAGNRQVSHRNPATHRNCPEAAPAAYRLHRSRVQPQPVPRRPRPPHRTQHPPQLRQPRQPGPPLSELMQRLQTPVQLRAPVQAPQRLRLRRQGQAVLLQHGNFQFQNPMAC